MLEVAGRCGKVREGVEERGMVREVAGDCGKVWEGEGWGGGRAAVCVACGATQSSGNFETIVNITTPASMVTKDQV